MITRPIHFVSRATKICNVWPLYCADKCVTVTPSQQDPNNLRSYCVADLFIAYDIWNPAIHFNGLKVPLRKDEERQGTNPTHCELGTNP